MINFIQKGMASRRTKACLLLHKKQGNRPGYFFIQICWLVVVNRLLNIQKFLAQHLPTSVKEPFFAFNSGLHQLKNKQKLPYLKV